MKIVIDISEDDYRKVQDGRASVSMMLKTIRNGTPQQKVGKWIAIENEDMEIVGYFCSNCDLPMETEEKTAYCPNCGQKKEGVIE